jgi:hypothetical protein
MRDVLSVSERAEMLNFFLFASIKRQRKHEGRKASVVNERRECVNKCEAKEKPRREKVSRIITVTICG